MTTSLSSVSSLDRVRERLNLVPTASRWSLFPPGFVARGHLPGQQSRIPRGGVSELGSCPSRSNLLNAELLQHAERIPVCPVLLNLSLRDANEVDPRHGHCLACGGDSAEIALVRTATCPANHHPIAFGHDVLDGDVGVGEGGAVHRHELLEGLRPLSEVRGERIVVVKHGIICANLVCDGKIPGIPNFLPQEFGDIFVCCGHSITSFNV